MGPGVRRDDFPRNPLLSQTCLGVPAARGARVFAGNVRPRKEGAGNAGRAVRPQPRVRMVVVDAHEYSQQSHRNRAAFPHAMVLTVSFVLSPAIGFLATVISRIKVLSGPVEPNAPPQDLTPASRRQDHTTSPSADSHLCQSPRRGLPRRSFSEGGRNSIVVLRA